MFIFNNECKEAFDCLKKALTTTPILQAPDWKAPFELMCDASNYALGVVLAQRINKQPRVIYYASRTLDAAQANYTIIEKELFAVVFASRYYIWDDPYMTRKCAVIRLPRDAFRTMRLTRSFNSIIHLHLVVILAHRGQLTRY